MRITHGYERELSRFPSWCQAVLLRLHFLIDEQTGALRVTDVVELSRLTGLDKRSILKGVRLGVRAGLWEILQDSSTMLERFVQDDRDTDYQGLTKVPLTITINYMYLVSKEVSKESTNGELVEKKKPTKRKTAPAISETALAVEALMKEAYTLVKGVRPQWKLTPKLARQIDLRLKETKLTVQDFGVVYQYRFSEWLGDPKMEDVINKPTSIFRESNFQKYVDYANERRAEGLDPNADYKRKSASRLSFRERERLEAHERAKDLLSGNR